MSGLTIRNLKVFFRDKLSVFFSLLSVFIIIALYALFLGDAWSSGLRDIENSRFIMDSWIMAGLLAVTSFTSTMGAFGIMIDDKSRKIIKDFYSAPLKRSSIAAGYLLSAFIIGVIMSIVTLVLMEVYIVASGGELISFITLIKVLLLILLSSLTNTAILFLISSYLKSENAFATASTIVGTLIGFLTGIYIPIGSLPEAVQSVIKVFPPSHAALLFRQVIMEAPVNEAFQGAPSQVIEGFKETMGVMFKLGDYTVTPAVSVAFLLVTGLVFFLLTVMNIAKKKR